MPYRWGGDDVDGFDCSGLVRYVLGDEFPELPRTADAQLRWWKGRGRARQSMVPADLQTRRHLLYTVDSSGKATHVAFLLPGVDTVKLPLIGEAARRWHVIDAPRAGGQVAAHTRSPQVGDWLVEVG